MRCMLEVNRGCVCVCLCVKGMRNMVTYNHETPQLSFSLWREVSQEDGVITIGTIGRDSVNMIMHLRVS